MPSNKDEITDMVTILSVFFLKMKLIKELQLKSLVESLLNWDMDRYN